MADQVLVPPTASSRIEPQRLAWGVLLIAFAIFCVVCVLTGIGVNYFLFQSSMPMEAVLSVGRGTVGITSEAAGDRYVRNTRTSLLHNSEVSTDPASQAVISFLDTLAGNRVVATVTVKNNSSVSLRSAARPRFEWSATGYTISLHDAIGQFDVQVAQDVERPILLSIRTRLNTVIDLDGSGSYVIDASDARTRLFNRTGSAKMILPALRRGLVIPPNSQGIVYKDAGDIELAPGYIELLQNSDFRALNQDTTQQLLAGWVCSNDPNDNPRGSYRSQLVEGVMTLRLERFENATSHGRTSCLQSFGQGLDLRGYDNLVLRARFVIHYQSLNACGIDGSECPLMLRMDYADVTGKPQIWYHGFYAVNNPELRFPMRCDSCPQEHEFINPGIWYTYDSGDLMTLFPDYRRPASLINLWFYASGHQFDVQVSEVSLVATTNTVP